MDQVAIKTVARVLNPDQVVIFANDETAYQVESFLWSTQSHSEALEAVKALHPYTTTEMLQSVDAILAYLASDQRIHFRPEILFAARKEEALRGYATQVPLVDIVIIVNEEIE